MATQHRSIWALIVTITTLFAGCIRPESPADMLPGITSLVQGTGNQLFTQLKQETLLVEIHSATGIGQATLTLTADLPVTTTLRLHLTGLEHLQVSNGMTTLVAQVSSQADHAILQSVAQAPTPVSAAQTIASDHPLWLIITPPTPAQPYFTVLLPPTFLAESDRVLTLAWVDFYR